MFQAITTKYLAATEHRGERVKATAQAGSVTLPWDYGLSTAENHEAAATALAQSEGKDWLLKGQAMFAANGRRLEGGGLPNGTGYAWVLVNQR
tara:strand:- start:708 stop:986 length:279 start_codon:yes stop_codon:yes gene_type:complete